MAQKVQVLLTCDLHGGSEMAATETIDFSVEGATYQIDLCDKHAKQLRDAVASYVAAGRRTNSRNTGSRRRSASSGSSADRERTQQIRRWARTKGIKVSERGRLSSDIIAKFEASGGR